MASGPYSFIDIAVLEPVRGRFAAGDALAILTIDLETVIWANGAGAALLGHSDIESAMGAPSGLGLPARRQIAATPGFPRALRERSVAVRLASGMLSRLATFIVGSITMPDGEPTVLLAEPRPKQVSRNIAEVAERIVEGIGEAGYFAAVIDSDAAIAAHSAGFDQLGIASATLSALVSEVARADDRLVKRLVPGAAGMIPAGIARLADEPALNLLIAIDEADEREEAPVPSDADLTERIEEDASFVAAREAQDRVDAVDGATDLHDDAREATTTGEELRAANLDGVGDMREATGPGRGSKTGESDDWYFSRQGASERSGEAAARAPAAPAASADTTTPFEPTLDRAAGPVRFVWRTDANGSFSMISPEFAAAVGPRAADVVGRSFGEVAARFGLDPDGEIGRLLDHRDTWSGRTVLWPVEGTDLVVPVDLAALPNYGRDRGFEGFRGFGVARTGDAIVDPAGLGLALDRAAGESLADEPSEQPDETSRDGIVPSPIDLAASDEQVAAGEAVEIAGTGAESAPAADPFRGEVPVISIADRRERRASDKVIRLAERRPAPTGGQLSAGERSAFEEIRERLRRDYEAPQDRPARGETAAGGEMPVDAAAAAVSDVMETDETRQAEAPALEHEVAQGGGEDADFGGVGDDFHDLADVAALDGVDRRLPADSGPVEEASVEMESPEDDVPLPPAAAEDDGMISPDAPAAIVSLDDGEDAGAEVAAYDEAAAAQDDHPPIVESRDGRAEAEDAEDLEHADTEIAGLAAGDRTAENVRDEARPSAAIETAGHIPSAFADDARRIGVDAELFAGLPLPILVHAGDDLYFANREFLALTGYSSLDQIRREGGLGRLFADGEPRMAAGEDDRKLRLRTLGGEEFPVDAHLQSIRWKNGTALLLALRKIASQVATAAPAAASGAIDIKEMERRVTEMRTIIDTATDGVVLIAGDGAIRSISRPAEALFGFDSAEVEGKPFHSLFAIESQRAARDYLNGLADNGVASVLNDGREVIGREAEGRFIPLFMTIGRLPRESGFCAVVRDITQWKRAEEELTQARALAERASSQKTEFLARVSHEIRTPLNAIIGFSELMIDEKFGPIHSDRYRDYLRDINRSGNHVLDLVNDLLDISKIEAGEQEMNYEAVSLNDTLAECVAMMQPQANRDRVIIRSSLASRLPEVVADLRSVRQIALNMLSNAIRYTQAGGQVIVSTSYEPSGDVVMRVRDTGIGMTLSEIDQALKPFKQINALKRGRHDGTGLGLPLTKAMVEANRARFAIASTPGEGTMVEITFPSTRVLAD